MIELAGPEWIELRKARCFQLVLGEIPYRAGKAHWAVGRILSWGVFAFAGLSGAFGDRGVLFSDLFACDHSQSLLVPGSEVAIELVLIVGDGAGAFAFLGDRRFVLRKGLAEG